MESHSLYARFVHIYTVQPSWKFLLDFSTMQTFFLACDQTCLNVLFVCFITILKNGVNEQTCVLLYKMGYLRFCLKIIVMRFLFQINFLFKFLCKWMNDVG